MTTTEPTYLLKDNDRHRVFTGVKKFHAKGYYGYKINAATGESWNLSEYNPEYWMGGGEGSAYDPLNRGLGTGHAAATAATFYQVAPAAKLYMLPTSALLSGTDPENKSYDKFVTEALPLIEKFNITNMFNSFNHSYDRVTIKLYREALQSVEDRFKTFFAMGNDSTSKYNPITDLEEVFGVAAYTLMVSGEVVPAYYSSESPTADFAAPSMIYINTHAKSADTKVASPQTGTSFSTPWLCGMSCLVDEFFIERTGRPLSRSAMYAFMKDHCIDLKTPGHDNKTGYGAVVLPDPSEIDIERYQPSDVDTPTTNIPVDKGDNDQMSTEKATYKSIQVDKYTQVDIYPYESIEEVGFAICQQPKETLKSFYDRQERKPDILVNGGLFSLKTGENIMSFIDEGNTYGTIEGYRGLGVKTEDPTKLVYGTDKEQWRDFMPCFPMLVMNGKAVPENEYYGAKSLNYMAARQAIGYGPDGIILITVDYDEMNKTGGMKFDKLTELFLRYGAEFAINLDGGGSVRKMVDGEVTNIPIENRPVDNVFYINLKTVEKEDESTVNDEFVAGRYYVAEETVGHSGADPDTAMMFAIPAGEWIDVSLVLPMADGMWGLTEYNYTKAFIKYTGRNLLTEEPVEVVEPEPEEETPVEPIVPEEPAEPVEPDEPKYTPGVYIVDVSSYLRVRSAPTTDSEVIGKLYGDERVSIFDIISDWGQLDLGNGIVGYVNMAYLKPCDAPITVEPDMGADCDEGLNRPIEDIDPRSVLGVFLDNDHISSWAQEAVADMVSVGVFTSSNSTFRPKDNCTREELAVALDRLYKLLSK